MGAAGATTRASAGAEAADRPVALGWAAWGALGWAAWGWAAWGWAAWGWAAWGWAAEVAGPAVAATCSAPPGC
jgi:hypothetical protein